MSSEKKYRQDEGHGWVERGERFPNDMLLRSFGFKIEKRPKKGPVMWSLEGFWFTEEEALEKCK